MQGGRKLFSRCTMQNTIFLECDIQQKLAKYIQLNSVVEHNAKRLTQISQIGRIPIIATRQIPKNFGDVAEVIQSVHHDGRQVFDKSTFSMLEEPVVEHLQPLFDGGRNQAVLYGVEAHVCIKQTCLDLLEKGLDVHLVIDAISSMNHHDRNIGIEAMRQAGAQVTTFQSLVFEILRDANDPLFKPMLGVVKDMPKDSEGNVQHLDI